MRVLILALALGVGLMMVAPGEASAQVCGPCDGTTAGGKPYHWFEFSENDHYSCAQHMGCHPSTEAGACSKHDPNECLNEEQQEQLAFALDAANSGELTRSSVDRLLEALGDRLAVHSDLGLVVALACDGHAVAQIAVPTEWLTTQ